MKWIPTHEAYRLFHETQIALAEVEAAGCRIDKTYLDNALKSTAASIRELESQMRADPIYAIWRKRHGEKTNLRSPAQLATIVFGELGHKAPYRTTGGDRDAADESALESVDLPFVRTYVAASKLRKAHGTYLMGIARELVQHDDGNYYVHPSFNLNTVESFRSSASDPNYQNNPVRNPEVGELIRRAYIGRPGQQILEIDYAQIEVKVGCAYHSDPTMIDYVNDPTKDMHRDMAAQIFMLDKKQISKETRHVAKNQFTFPAFYGSYYCQIAPSIWEAVDRRKLVVEGSSAPVLDDSGRQTGTRPLTVREHLTAKGITELGECNPDERPVQGTFEYHLQEIENDFWGRRFQVYARWKKDWFAAYQKKGGCQFLTGFVMRGPHKRNDVNNYAIQGGSFHCLAWSLVKIVNCLRRYKMRTRVIGEVHDSWNGDAAPRERDDVIHLATRIMTEDIKAWAPWLNVQLSVEAECCPVGGSWHEKAVLEEKGGVWVPANPAKWTEKYGAWEKQCV